MNQWSVVKFWFFHKTSVTCWKSCLTCTSQALFTAKLALTSKTTGCFLCSASRVNPTHGSLGNLKQLWPDGIKSFLLALVCLHREATVCSTAIGRGCETRSRRGSKQRPPIRQGAPKRKPEPKRAWRMYAPALWPDCMCCTLSALLVTSNFCAGFGAKWQEIQQMWEVRQCNPRQERGVWIRLFTVALTERQTEYEGCRNHSRPPHTQYCMSVEVCVLWGLHYCNRVCIAQQLQVVKPATHKTRLSHTLKFKRHALYFELHQVSGVLVVGSAIHLIFNGHSWPDLAREHVESGHEMWLFKRVPDFWQASLCLNCHHIVSANASLIHSKWHNECPKCCLVHFSDVQFLKQGLE